MPDAEDLRITEELTVEAWVKARSLSGQPIIYKESYGHKGHQLAIGLYETGKPEAFLAEGYEGEFDSIAGAKSLEANVWTHLAFTYDGGKMRLYVNGELVDDKGHSEGAPWGEGDLVFGCNPNYPPERFEGLIDEIRVYNRALNVGELAADSGAGLQTPSRTPVAAYSFDAGEGAVAEDTTGNEHEGAIAGAGWFDKGRYGSALGFDGEEGEEVTIADADDLDFSEEFTLEAWVKPRKTVEWSQIITKQRGSGISYQLTAHADHNAPVGYIRGAEKEWGVDGGTTPLPTNVWSHIAYTSDGGRLRFYVNGELKGTASGFDALTGTGALVIGGGIEGEVFEGLIDEVRVYDRALGEDEVGTDKSAPLQTPSRSPVAAFAFDEGEGTTAEDLTGNGHTATIEEGEWARGRYGDALKFEGGTKCLSIADAPDLRLSEEFTLEAWVRPLRGVYDDPVIVKESEGETSYGLGLGSRTEGMAEGFIGEGGEAQAALADQEAREYAWTHIATTYDGAILRVYVDGELSGSEAAPDSPATASGALKIGCDIPDGQFSGGIDEARIYDRALDGAEVQADRSAPLQTPQADPVAAYSFDEGEGESAEDLSGNGHTATIEGAQWTEKGRYGAALQFDASAKDVLKVPDSPQLDFSEEFTLEAWVRPSGADNHSAPLIDKQQSGGVGYFLYEGGSVSDRPVGAASKEQEFIHADEPLDAHAWSHVALTFNGNRTFLYVNGELIDNGAAEPITSSEGDLEIGGSTETGEYFDGRIDEVRVYDRALDDGEVQADKATPLQTPSRSPIAAYSFDAGEGAVAEDVTGNEHDGTIAGASWFDHGKYGKALSFDGEDDCVTVADAEDLRITEELTVEAWVKPRSPVSDDPVIYKDTWGHKGHELAIGVFESGKPEAFIGEGEGEFESVVAPKAVEANVWSHLAFTYDGAHMRLYVNGELVASQDQSEGPPWGEGDLVIGCNPNYPEHFEGLIDEVRVYNRALSEGELEPNQGPDVVPPDITLSGPLAEGLKEGTKEYDLNIQAIDGAFDKRGSGVKSVTVAVDGEAVDSVTQKCPGTNCSLHYVWTFDQEIYGFEPHTIVVSAEDHVGNVSSEPLQLAVPNGSIPACSPTGTPVESAPDEVKELPNGGSKAIFQGADGEKIEYRSGPPGFDPKEGSDEELDLYGYPPRPPITEPAGRAVWEETVGESTGSAEPGGCMGVSAPDFAASSGAGSTTVQYSESHAGWLIADLEGPANQWRGSAAIYRVPKLRQTCTGQPAAHLSYVGVGGSTESAPFFQAGTNQPYGVSKNSDIAAFTEFFRGGAGKGTRRSERPKFENLNIQPGDEVFVVALWKPGPEKVLMYVQNLRTGKKISPEQPGKESVFFDGRKLEYVTAERPLLNKDQRFQQQNFGTFGFRGAVAWVSGEGVQALGAQKHRVRLEMQRSKNNRPIGNLMVSTSSISNSGQGFQATWHGCHP